MKENYQKLLNENKLLKKDNKRLRKLCEEKDSFFMEMISEGLRKGSKLAAKHMAERKDYKKRNGN